MAFPELNAVEHFIIHRLTGVNLGKTAVQEPTPAYDGPRWQYVPAAELKRAETDVLLEADVRAALVRLNPEVAAQPAPTRCCTACAPLSMA